MWLNHEENKVTEALYDASPVKIAQKKYAYPLHYNPHMMLLPPGKNGETITTGYNMQYFHTGCDGKYHGSWGDGYRTIQSACSLVVSQLGMHSMPMPSIEEIQRILVACECKQPEFIGSHDKVGALEAFYVIRKLYKVPCQFVHIGSEQSLKTFTGKFKKFFREFRGFIVLDTSNVNGTECKGIAGVHIDNDEVFLLLVSPNFHGIPKSPNDFIDRGTAKWVNINTWAETSFDMCLPQPKINPEHAFDEEADSFLGSETEA